MESGWLLRDGEVLASTAQLRGWRARIVSPRSFDVGVGALVVTGPALCWGSPLARIGESRRVRAVTGARGPHFVAPSRHGIVLEESVADKVRVGDDLELRLAS